MILRTAWKTLRNSWAMNGVTVLQLSAALLVTAMMVSSICLRYSRYTPFKDFFQGRGSLAQYLLLPYFPTQKLDDFGEIKLVETDADFSEFLSAPVETLGLHALYAHLEPKSDELASDSYYNIQLASMDGELIDRYTPSIAEGRWLTSNADVDMPEAVISYQTDDWQVGDIVTLHFTSNSSHDETLEYKKDVDVRIVGMLADGAEIPGRTGEITNDFRDFFAPWSREREDRSIMLLSYPQIEALDAKPATQQPYYPMILMHYTEPVTEEQCLADQQLMMQNGASVVFNLEDMDTRSRTYLWQEIYNLLPIVVMLMILVAVSSISTTALATRRRLHDYAVYALSGLPWNRCILINAAQSVMTASAAAVMAFVGGAVISRSALKDTFYLHLNGWVLLVSGGVILLYLAVSLLMPYVMLRRNSVREILKMSE